MSVIDTFHKFLLSVDTQQVKVYAPDRSDRYHLHTLADKHNLYSWSVFDSELDYDHILVFECQHCGKKSSCSKYVDVDYSDVNYQCPHCDTKTYNVDSKQYRSNNIVVLSRLVNPDLKYKQRRRQQRLKSKHLSSYV